MDLGKGCVHSGGRWGENGPRSGENGSRSEEARVASPDGKGQKGNPGGLIAKVLWDRGLAWMSPPGFPKHVAFSRRVVVVVSQHPPVQSGVRR